jgi:hypothetical protein
MATWDEVRVLALALPETREVSLHGNPSWRVRDKLFLWERPLRSSDYAALGADAPDGPILGARVEHEGAKQALLQSAPSIYFTTPHFDGYPAILVRLEAIAREELQELAIDAWLARAPKRLAAAFLAEHDVD